MTMASLSGSSKRPVPRTLAAALAAGLLSCLAAPAWAAAPPLPAPTVTGPVGGTLMASGGVVASLPPGVPAPPQVDAHSWLVADADSGAVLAAKAPHQLLRPASTLKTLTALTVGDLAPTRVYTAVAQDANVEGSRVGIVPGGQYTVDQLWQGLFLRSGNDTASALANLHGGWATTVADMNALAHDLHAEDTHAVNPSGLDADGQTSSAYDLALLGRAMLARPDLMHYAGMLRSRFPGKMAPPGKPRPSFAIYTEQKFVTRYPGAIGIKNGYTSKAQNTLVVAARRGDRTLLVTLMKGHANAWKQAGALADWGFAHAAAVAPVGELVAPGAAPVIAPTASATPLPVPAAAAPRGAPRVSARRALRGTGMLAGIAATALFAVAGTAVVRGRTARRRDPLLALLRSGS